MQLKTPAHTRNNNFGIEAHCTWGRRDTDSPGMRYHAELEMICNSNASFVRVDLLALDYCNIVFTDDIKVAVLSA